MTMTARSQRPAGRGVWRTYSERPLYWCVGVGFGLNELKMVLNTSISLLLLLLLSSGLPPGYVDKVLKTF